MKRKSVTNHHHLPADKMAQLIKAIRDNKKQLSKKKVTAGFDGFIDGIVKVIKKKQPKKPASFFKPIQDFGAYIVDKEGTSFSLELQEQNTKIGGNMPIMANAIGQLGIAVNCIGALGYPWPHSIFTNLYSNCNLLSFANPGIATAYEFTDGKIMLAQMGELNTAGWQEIKDVIGLDTLTAMFRNSDIICALNWSEIDASTDIWKGILKDILADYSSKQKKQIVFFDLSDCSKKSSQSIREAMELLQRFAKYTKVILSLNKNESAIIYKVLYSKNAKEDLAVIGKKIMEKLNIQILLLHSSKEAMVFSNGEYARVDSFFTSKPKISTGAGDNFNAGFCAAQLFELDLESPVITANAVTGLYIRKGISPQLPDIINFLETIPTSN